jgi:hypothetical protein
MAKKVKEKVKLKLRPEEIVRYLTDNGKLPDDFNPYGDYEVAPLKFLGDTEPTPIGEGYHGADEWIVINNNDNDLIPIYISLPKPPPLKLIDGYKSSQDDQVFIRKSLPEKLRELQSKALDKLNDIQKRNYQESIQGYKVYREYWNIFDEESELYWQEIEWIKHIWWHRTYGYWFYNDGQPTYITGDYFDFLTFWYISEANTFPEYRDKDRVKYIFAKYVEEATETFAKFDKDTGRALKEPDGSYEMLDLGRRVLFGDVEPKTRRSGATHQCIHKIWKGNSTTFGAYGTIVSMEGKNAEKHYFRKLLPAWDKYPMFLKPIWTGNRRPTSIKMVEPPNVYDIEGLGSIIDYTDSAGERKNDGDRLNYVLLDEQGKTVASDIFERWNVNKIAMSTGGGTNIIKDSYAKNPSTVEEMDSGGVSYYKLCQLSNFYERMPIKGQTHSGLARIFFPAYVGLEGYIDKFGKSVIETPTERQIRLSPRMLFAMSKKGAKETLQAERDSLLAKGTPEALEQYRSLRRKHPFKWEECWLGSAGSVGFNLEILDKRMGEINRDKSFGKLPYKIGNLRRTGDKDSDVVFEENRETGKFKMSMDLPKELTNRRTQEMGFDASQGMFVPMWKPIGGDYFTMGADPFQYMNKNLAKLSVVQSRQSDGGLAILYNNGKEKHFVLSYRNRPASQYEYMEDAIMACQYYSCMCYPETNIADLYKHFIERGYGGYLLYQIDIKTGKLKEKPGEFTGLETRDGYFTAVKDYIEFYGATECHDDILKEFRDIQGPDAMTHYDLFTAAALALRGDMTRYRQVMEMQNSMTIDLDGIGVFRKRRF